jgi:hypothetical protein
MIIPPVDRSCAPLTRQIAKDDRTRRNPLSKKAEGGSALLQKAAGLEIFSHQECLEANSLLRQPSIANRTLLESKGGMSAG